MINRIIDTEHPYLFVANPKKVIYKKISSEVVEERVAETPFDPVYKDHYARADMKEGAVCVSLIDGKYYIDEIGYNYLKAIKTVMNNSEIDIKLKMYGSSEVMKTTLYNLYGVDHERYEELFMEPIIKFQESFHEWHEQNPIHEASVGSTISQPEDFLRKYIGNYNTIKSPAVPMLIGHTGIAKSALIEKLARELTDWTGYGFRMVNIKAGFIDKADLMGFVSEGQIEVNGKMLTVAQDSPMKDLLTSTDSFVGACRKALEDEDPTQLEGDELEAYKRLKHYAKTPILFFDEVNRTKKSIMAQLMVIFNQKRLMDKYHWKNAPMVCASNWAIDVDYDKFGDMYEVETTHDEAIRSRFQLLEVSHKDETVINATLAYLEKKYSVDIPFVGNLLRKAHSEESFYNPEFRDGNSKFPTFRAWEYMLQYLVAKKKLGEQGALCPEIVTGLFGFNDASTGFIDEVNATTSSGSVIPDDFSMTGESNDPYQTIIDESLKANIPVLLLGRFGIAKTARIEKKARTEGAEIYNIDLSAQDRTTARGFPKKELLTRNVFGDLINTDVASKFTQITEENLSVPKYTTAYVPFDFKEKVENCLIENKPLYLFFDELNRADAIVQSSIFDAISDKKVLGVDISELVDRGLVRILSAGNVGENYDVQDLDSATLARFATYRQDIMTMNDVDSFIENVVNVKLSPLLAECIGAMKNTVLDILNSEVNSFNSDDLSERMMSFRTFRLLDNFIRYNTGFLMFFDAVKFTEVEDIISALTNPNYLGRQYGSNYTVINEVTKEQQSLEEYIVWFEKNVQDMKSNNVDGLKAVMSDLIEIDKELYSTFWRRGIYMNFNQDISVSEEFLKSLESKLVESLFKSIAITDEEIVGKIVGAGIVAKKTDTDKLGDFMWFLMKNRVRVDSGGDVVKQSVLREQIEKIMDELGKLYPIAGKMISSVIKRIEGENYDDIDFDVKKIRRKKTDKDPEPPQPTPQPTPQTTTTPQMPSATQQPQPTGQPIPPGGTLPPQMPTGGTASTTARIYSLGDAIYDDKNPTGTADRVDFMQNYGFSYVSSKSFTLYYPQRFISPNIKRKGIMHKYTSEELGSINQCVDGLGTIWYKQSDSITPRGTLFDNLLDVDNMLAVDNLVRFNHGLDGMTFNLLFGLAHDKSSSTEGQISFSTVTSTIDNSNGEWVLENVSPHPNANQPIHDFYVNTCDEVLVKVITQKISPSGYTPIELGIIPMVYTLRHKTTNDLLKYDSFAIGSLGMMLSNTYDKTNGQLDNNGNAILHYMRELTNMTDEEFAIQSFDRSNEVISTIVSHMVSYKKSYGLNTSAEEVGDLLASIVNKDARAIIKLVKRVI